MADNAIHSYNTTLYYGLSNANTTLSGVVSVSFGEVAATAAPSDTLADLVKLTVPGKVDPGEATVTCRFAKTVFNTVLSTLFRTSYKWKVVYPSTNIGTLDWTGYVRTVSPPQAADDETINFTFTIKPTTAYVFSIS